MIERVVRQWNRFWFWPVPVTSITGARIAICSVAAIWMASFWPTVPDWFGEDGLLPNRLAGLLIADEGLPRWMFWSPLWMTDALLAYHAWLAVGIVICLAAALGVGGRITLAVLLLWIIAWAHRISWMQGTVEPALIGLTAYLILEPGPSLVARGESKVGQVSWTANTALRLIQVHWWILIAAGLLSQLAGIVWWRGEAVWWLASAGRSSVLTTDLLRDQATVVNVLTHGSIITSMMALWLITLPATRPLGIGFGILVALSVGLVADQLLYAVLLASCLWAFRTPAPAGADFR